MLGLEEKIVLEHFEHARTPCADVCAVLIQQSSDEGSVTVILGLKRTGYVPTYTRVDTGLSLPAEWWIVFKEPDGGGEYFEIRGSRSVR